MDTIWLVLLLLLAILILCCCCFCCAAQVKALYKYWTEAFLGPPNLIKDKTHKSKSGELSKKRKSKVGAGSSAPTDDDDEDNKPPNKKRKNSSSRLESIRTNATSPRTSSPVTSSKETSSKVTTSKGTSSKVTTSKGTSSKGPTSKRTSSKVTTPKGTSSKGKTSKGTSSMATTSTGVTIQGTTSPGTTSSATTSPGTTSPGTTSPGTTSPGTTSPETTTQGPSTVAPSFDANPTHTVRMKAQARRTLPQTDPNLYYNNQPPPPVPNQPFRDPRLYSPYRASPVRDGYNQNYRTPTWPRATSPRPSYSPSPRQTNSPIANSPTNARTNKAYYDELKRNAQLQATIEAQKKALKKKEAKEEKKLLKAQQKNIGKTKKGWKFWKKDKKEDQGQYQEQVGQGVPQRTTQTNTNHSYHSPNKTQSPLNDGPKKKGGFFKGGLFKKKNKAKSYKTSQDPPRALQNPIQNQTKSKKKRKPWGGWFRSKKRHSLSGKKTVQVPSNEHRETKANNNNNNNNANQRQETVKNVSTSPSEQPQVSQDKQVNATVTDQGQSKKKRKGWNWFKNTKRHFLPGKKIKNKEPPQEPREGFSSVNSPPEMDQEEEEIPVTESPKQERQKKDKSVTIVVDPVKKFSEVVDKKKPNKVTENLLTNSDDERHSKPEPIAASESPDQKSVSARLREKQAKVSQGLAALAHRNVKRKPKRIGIRNKKKDYQNQKPVKPVPSSIEDHDNQVPIKPSKEPTDEPKKNSPGQENDQVANKARHLEERQSTPDTIVTESLDQENGPTKQTTEKLPKKTVQVTVETAPDRTHKIENDSHVTKQDIPVKQEKQMADKSTQDRANKRDTKNRNKKKIEQELLNKSKDLLDNNWLRPQIRPVIVPIENQMPVKPSQDRANKKGTKNKTKNEQDHRQVASPIEDQMPVKPSKEPTDEPKKNSSGQENDQVAKKAHHKEEQRQSKPDTIVTASLDQKSVSAKLREKQAKVSQGLAALAHRNVKRKRKRNKKKDYQNQKPVIVASSTEDHENEVPIKPSKEPTDEPKKNSPGQENDQVAKKARHLEERQSKPDTIVTESLDQESENGPTKKAAEKSPKKTVPKVTVETSPERAHKKKKVRTPMKKEDFFLNEVNQIADKPTQDGADKRAKKKKTKEEGHSKPSGSPDQKPENVSPKQAKPSQERANKKDTKNRNKKKPSGEPAQVAENLVPECSPGVVNKAADGKKNVKRGSGTKSPRNSPTNDAKKSRDTLANKNKPSTAVKDPTTVSPDAAMCFELLDKKKPSPKCDEETPSPRPSQRTHEAALSNEPAPESQSPSHVKAKEDQARTAAIITQGFSIPVPEVSPETPPPGPSQRAHNALFSKPAPESQSPSHVKAQEDQALFAKLEQSFFSPVPEEIVFTTPFAAPKPGTAVNDPTEVCPETPPPHGPSQSAHEALSSKPAPESQSPSDVQAQEDQARTAATFTKLELPPGMPPPPGFDFLQEMLANQRPKVDALTNPFTVPMPFTDFSQVCQCTSCQDYYYMMSKSVVQAQLCLQHALHTDSSCDQCKTFYRQLTTGYALKYIDLPKYDICANMCAIHQNDTCSLHAKLLEPDKNCLDCSAIFTYMEALKEAGMLRCTCHKMCMRCHVLQKNHPNLLKYCCAACIQLVPHYDKAAKAIPYCRAHGRHVDPHYCPVCKDFLNKGALGNLNLAHLVVDDVKIPDWNLQDLQ